MKRAVLKAQQEVTNDWIGNDIADKITWIETVKSWDSKSALLKGLMFNAIRIITTKKSLEIPKEKYIPQLKNQIISRLVSVKYVI